MMFTVPSWLPVTAGIAMVLVTACLALYLWRRLEASRIRWKPLTGHTGIFWTGPDDFEELQLTSAFAVAVRSLVAHTVWGDRIHGALANAHISVSPTDEWADARNGTVAGLDPEGPIIIVGRDLAALAHELAHQAEAELDHAIDYEHRGWTTKSVWASIEEYQKWLDGQ